jgi:hypothetical protein
MRKIIFLSVVATALGGATLASASDYRATCTAAPASQWLSTQELAAKFETQGYTVWKIKFKGGCGEAKLLDKSGVRTEVYFDPTNGVIQNRQSHHNRHYRYSRHDDR